METKELRFGTIKKMEGEIEVYQTRYTSGKVDFTLQVSFDGEVVGLETFGTEEELNQYLEASKEKRSFTVQMKIFNSIRNIRFMDEVLRYERKGDDIVAYYKEDKFFIVIENTSFNFDLNLFKGLTLGGFYEKWDYLVDIAYDEYVEDVTRAYFGASECSTCGGGGCVHCSPNDFI